MATITISRDSGYADRARAYSIILDSQKIGELHNGEKKEFSIKSGLHKIAMKIDWCGSKEMIFTVAENQTLLFFASSNLRGLKLFLSVWYVFFNWNSYLRIEQIATDVDQK